MPTDNIADAIDRNFTSPNVPDTNMEPANVVDVLASASANLRLLWQAITPPSVGTDATGTGVGSLTESVMGVAAGLVEIADAIESLAEAVREAGTRNEH